MPRNGQKRYLYSVRGWLAEKRPFPEEALGTAIYVENKERKHESGWQFREETKDRHAIELALKRYGKLPLS